MCPQVQLYLKGVFDSCQDHVHKQTAGAGLRSLKAWD